MSTKQEDSPQIGIALWLVRGRSVADNVKWLAEHNFSSVALLPNDYMRLRPAQKTEAANAMKQAGMMVTYHGNIHSNRLWPGNMLDEDFVARMIEDVIWWHENAGGVSCCCSDPITVAADDGKEMFHRAESIRLARLFSKALQPLGIRVGIENGFGLEGRMRSIADIAKFKEVFGQRDIGILLDAGHANIHVQSDGVDGENDLGRFVRSIPLDIREVHLSDNHGQQDEHKPLGQGNGNLDLVELISALRARGFSGPFTLEFNLGDVSEEYGSYIDDPEKADAILTSRDAVLSAWSHTNARATHGK